MLNLQLDSPSRSPRNVLLAPVLLIVVIAIVQIAIAPSARASSRPVAQETSTCSKIRQPNGSNVHRFWLVAIRTRGVTCRKARRFYYSWRNLKPSFSVPESPRSNSAIGFGWSRRFRLNGFSCSRRWYMSPAHAEYDLSCYNGRGAKRKVINVARREHFEW